MPIDPNIPLSVQGVGPLVNPMQVMQQAEQLRASRENSLALAEQRRSQAAQRQQETDALARQNADRAATSEALRQGGGVRDQTLTWARTNAPGTIPTLTEFFDKSDKSAADIKDLNSKLNDARLNHLGHMADGVLSHGTTPETLQAGLSTALSLYAEQFPDEKDQIAQTAARLQGAAPDQLRAFLEQTRDSAPYRQAELSKIAERGPVKVGPNETVLGPDNKPVYTAPPKEEHSPAYKEWQDAVSTGYKGSFTQYQNEDANRRRSITNINTGQPTDVQDTIAGMMDGSIPPQLPGRASKEYVALLAEAKRRGYNLSAAVTDWNATQKHIATLNGAQQLRLNQSINSLPDMLDSVDALASKWKGGKFPILNKANLALAKGGAYGSDAASIANQLDAQIADVTADLGNVYMGGNSPTDHALGLAGKSLQGEWDEKVLHDMVKLARQNVTIRRNSIANTGVAGASDNNPYVPGGGAPAAVPIAAPATGGRGAAPVTAGAQQRPIPGIPGGIAELRNGKWIRIQ